MMISLSFLLQKALVHGFVLCVLLSVVIAFSFAINPEIWLNDYPPDIKERYGPIGDKAKRQRIPIAILLFVVTFGTVSFGLVQLFKAANGNLAFLSSFIYSFIVFLVFNVYDLLILDWLVFVTIRPRRIILPGTEGMRGYGDYAFHFRGFLTGVVFSAIGGLVVSGVATAVNLLWYAGGSP